MSDKKTMKIRFLKSRDTKNTIRFDEVVPDDDVQEIGSLYLQKHFAKELGFPDTVTVTVETS